MSDYGSTYEEIVRKITSIDSLKSVTRVPSEGAFQKKRPFAETQKNREVEGESDTVVAQTKTAVFVSSTTAKFENTNLRTNVTTYTQGSDIALYIDGVFIPDDKFTLNFESPDLIVTFNTQLLGYVIDTNDVIILVGAFTN